MQLVNVVTELVMSMKIAKAVLQTVVNVVNVQMVISLTVLIMIAVQSPGMVTVLKIVKTRLMAVISPVMTAMVVTVVLTVALMVVQMVAVMFMDVQIQMHVTMMPMQLWMMAVAKS